jgi:hypothetical protein
VSSIEEDRTMTAMSFAVAEELNITIHGLEHDDFINRLNAALHALDPETREQVLDRAHTRVTQGAIPPIIRSTSEADYELRPTVMVCDICKESLNWYGSAQGGYEKWVHSRGWDDHDHEPVPVEIPRIEHTNRICDFCGRSDILTWEFRGQRLQVYDKFNHTDRDYGNIWQSCDLCGEYIKARDVEGLVSRIMRTSAALRQMKMQNDPVQREALISLHGKFVPSIHTEIYIGPPPEVPELRPRQMPKIRDGLTRFWSSESTWHRLSGVPNPLSLPGFAHGHDLDTMLDEIGDDISRLYNSPGFRVRAPGNEMPRPAFNAATKHFVTGLLVGDLYYVSADFTQLAIESGKELPDLSITREELPTSHGFVVWANPVGEIQRPDGAAAVRAMSWTLVPHGVWIHVYFQPEDGDLHYKPTPEHRQEVGYLLSPNTGLGLPFGNLGSMPDNQGNNMLSTLLATWFLMRQPGVATETTQPVDKGLTRSYKRAGRRTPEVTIVDLRRQAARVAAREETVEDMIRRKIGVRFLVRGHWKRQAYGPKRGLRKTIYVSPFMKGPDGAPLKAVRTTVKVLR